MGISNNSLGNVVLRLALGLFLLAYGIMTVQTNGSFWGLGGNEVSDAVRSFLTGEAANAVIIAIGVCAIVAGAGVLVSFFATLGAAMSIFYVVVLIVWIGVIVVVDILGRGGLLNGAFSNFNSFAGFIRSFAQHMLVLGAMLVVRQN